MTSFSDSAFARLLAWVARQVCAYPRWFIYSQVAIALGCLAYTALTLKLDMNRDNLIGARMKYHQIYMRFRREFPGEDELVVVVESSRPERNREFIERLANRVKRNRDNLFVDLFYKGDFTSLGRKGLLLAPTADLEQMRQALHQYLPFIREFGQATNLNSLFHLVDAQFRNAGNGGNAQAESMLGALPFLEQIITHGTQEMLRPGTPVPPPLEGMFGGGAQAEQQVYLTFSRGRLFLLTVRPRSEPVTAQAVERLRAMLEETQLDVPGVDAGLTGGPVLDYDEMKQSEHDSIVASIAALVICSLIFIVAYREVGRPLKAALCLLVGLGYTMGFTTLTVGHLNILSITFAPMLIGLAIDFGIHFTSRYEEETRNGYPVSEAVHRATVFTGQGIVTGGLTTAAAFLAMALTNFKGIREMGLISGGGLLLCLVPMMTALPALLMRGPQNQRDHQRGALGRRRVRIEDWWLRRPLLLTGGTLLVCAGAAALMHRVHFDYNLLHMQSQSLPSVVYEKKLMQSADRSVLFAAVIADSPQQAQAYTQRLKTLPSVADVESVADYFTHDQQQKLQLVAAIKGELKNLRFAPIDRSEVHLDELGATLWYFSGYLGLAADAAQRAEPTLARQLRGFRSEVMDFHHVMLSGQPGVDEKLTRYQQALLGEVRQTFAALQHQDISPLRPQDLPPALHDRFIGITGKFLLQVYPRKDLWQHNNQREFLAQLDSAVPPERVTGTPLQLYEYTTLLKTSYEQAALYSLAAIIIMVLLHFRSLLSVVLALLPVAIGSTWLLGFMGLAGISFNPANIMTLPLVVGIGVTNGIQILNRYAEECSPRLLAKSTGKSVLVSGLTAITGFGTLMLAKHQGIRSLGEVMAFGIAACMVVSLTFLPALLCLLMHRGWRLGLCAEPAPHPA